MQTFRLHRHLLWVGMFLVLSWSASAQVKIGNNPTSINASALLELENKSNQSKGMIFPRIALGSTTSSDMGNSATAVTGMVVYNTKSDISGSTAYPAAGVGVYAFDGTGWVFGGLPSGGSSGQVLSKTSTGVAWSSPSGGGITTYQASGSSTSGAGALIKATGSGVTFSVNTTTQTATITVPNGVEIISARVYDNAASFSASSYGLSGDAGVLKIQMVFGNTGVATNYSNAQVPLVDVLIDAIPPLFLNSQGPGLARPTGLTDIGIDSNSYTITIPTMDPVNIGSKWLVILNF